MKQNKYYVDNRNSSKEIQKLLRNLGLNSSYKGFWQTVYAVNLAVEDPETLSCVCKGLYVDVASHFHTSIYCVERNIRTVKQIIWTFGNEDVIRQVFHCLPQNTAPSNTLFIDQLANYILDSAEKDPCMVP